ncbi:MAG: sulfur carrier protein ThiS [Acidimicrobiales bacterium]
MTDTPPRVAGPTVNGAPYDAPAGTTVADLVAAWCPSPRGVAVAVDGEVVPRSTWSERMIGPGDRVEIVHGVAGG